MNPRVVLDTNCIVSALLFSRKNMAWLRHEWQSGSLIPLVNKETVSELIRVFNYPKFKLTPEERTLLLADFLPYAETVLECESPANLPIIRDPYDQKFLTLAVVSQADVLVTGDKDLLVIKETFTKPPIMTISEFEHWLKNIKNQN